MTRLVLMLCIWMAVWLQAPQLWARTCRASQATKTRSGPTTTTASLRKDVDGDGRPDTLRSADGWGSGAGSFTVTLELTNKDVPSFDIEGEYSFARMVDETPVPIELLETRFDDLRAAIEDVAFSRVCDSPDPSFERLRDPSGPLDWHDGKPVAPQMYTVLDRTASPPAWYTYKGNVHTLNNPPDAPAFRRAAHDDRYVVYLTHHGAVVTDAAGTRYAWLYVFPGNDQKLRHASMKSATVEGNTVVIELAHPSPRRARMGVVRVDLATGATAVKWHETAPE